MKNERMSALLTAHESATAEQLEAMVELRKAAGRCLQQVAPLARSLMATEEGYELMEISIALVRLQVRSIRTVTRMLIRVGAYVAALPPPGDAAQSAPTEHDELN
jgi:hypothetical protein